VPVLAHPVQQVADLEPALVADGEPVPVHDVDAVERLAEDVELKLVGGAVATRTGLDPRYPSQCSRTSSDRSLEPSTRYMTFSGLLAPSTFCPLTRSPSQRPNAAASSVKPMPSRAYTENEASRTQV